MRTIVTTAFLSLLATGPVCAQTAGPDDAATDDIVVTGEKSRRTVQETMTSVAVVTPARIRQENIQTIQDVYNRTANVGETYGAAGFTIRGINNAGVGGGGQADTATVYVDGAPIPGNALFGGPTDLWDIAQVEILRGPQSTIQGLNALAGAVVLTTRDASTTDTSADARMLWSDQRDRTFSAALGGPIVTDQLGIRLSAERRNDRGLIRNVTLGGYDDALQTLSLRGKLKWTPLALPGLDVQASYNRVRRDGGYLYDYARTDVADFYDHRISTGNVRGRGRVAADIAVLNAGYDIAPRLRLSSVTSFNRVSSHALADGDGGPVDAQRIDNLYRFRTWTQEVRLNYDGPRLSGVLGGWAYRRAGGLDANNRLNIATPVTSIVTQLRSSGFPSAAATRLAASYAAVLPRIPVAYTGAQPQLVRTAALFADARYRVTDRLSLIAGVRLDHEENRYAAQALARFTGTLPDPAAFGAPGTAPFLAVTAINRGVLALVANASSQGAGKSRRFDALLPKAGISMDWTPDLTTSVSVQRAYRSGGSSANPARGLLVPYDPEHSWNYEASLRSRWFGGRLTLNANAFYVDWSAQQTNVFFGSSAYDYNTVNAGSSHLSGFEVEASARVAPGVDTYASLGHVRTRFDRFTVPSGSTASLDLAGSEFPYAARWTLAGGVNVRAGTIVGNLNASYRSAVFTETGVTQASRRLPGRTIVNARIGRDVKNWTLFAFARNLLDAKYEQYTFQTGDRAILGDPQTFGLGAELHL